VSKQVIHRLYTEDVNRQAIADILTKYFHAFTIFESKGVWEGQAEKSLCIEVLGASFQTVSTVATAIKETNKQDAVLYTAHEVKVKLF
jgi:hypothetical protein